MCGNGDTGSGVRAGHTRQGMVSDVLADGCLSCWCHYSTSFPQMCPGMTPRKTGVPAPGRRGPETRALSRPPCTVGGLAENGASALFSLAEEDGGLRGCGSPWHRHLEEEYSRVCLRGTDVHGRPGRAPGRPQRRDSARPPGWTVNPGLLQRHPRLLASETPFRNRPFRMFPGEAI